MDDRQTMSVRRRLAIATARQHESLHSHPWIASLTEADLTYERYSLILSAYLRFFQAVEGSRARMGAFPACGLSSSIEALSRDTEGCHPLSSQAVRADVAHVEGSRDAMIGALYVLHGAGFGARTLCAAVMTTLPEAECGYLSAGTPPKLWRSLLAELERLADSPVREERLVDSAAQTFASFGRFVTSFCENAPTGALAAAPCDNTGRPPLPY